MVYQEFRILEIKGVYHSEYGKCIMVYANPIEKKENSIQFVTTIDKNTFKFLFQNKYLDELLQISKEKDFWTPDVNYYLKERFFDDESGYHCPIYVHIDLDLDNIGLLEDDYEGVDINDDSSSQQESLIPNLTEKWKKVVRDWETMVADSNTDWDYKEDGDPAEYFGNECYENGRLFSWLFEDESIQSDEDLTEEQYEAFQSFISELENDGCYR